MKVKKKSQLQEKSVAKELNAKTVIASGALWGSKGDVRHDQILVECKTTEKSFYSLTMSVWDKIRREAVRDGLRIPVMCVDLFNGKERFAVFESKDFKYHKHYFEIEKGDVCESDKKSFHVDCIKEVVMTKSNRSFTIIKWDDFLYVLEGGD